jgi:hypothetical protein
LKSWATSRAYGRSWKFCSGPNPSKPSEYVWMGFVTRRLISATFALESTPPDKNAPTGTSDMSRFFTAFSSRPRTPATASASVTAPAAGQARSPSGDQKRSIVTLPPLSQTRRCPAGRRLMPANRLWGGGTAENAR